MSEYLTEYKKPSLSRGATLSGVLFALLLTVGIAVIIWINACPCERTPGSYLLGDVIREPIGDWSFANTDVRLCQIEVRRVPLPHSVNLNCMADGGELFLSCAGCDGKTWSTAALADSRARLRINDRVYPVLLSRVTDAATLDRAWQARARKLGRPTDQPRDDGWWSFRVESRS